MSLIEKVLSKLDHLPSLPESVARLSKAIGLDSTSAEDINKIIKPDPSITTNLLKLANSAYFGFVSEIVSVKQAVVLMGQKRVYELALGGAFSKIIPPKLKGFEMTSRDFWLHSIAVAILSESLAKILKLEKIDMIFTAGLLHDIGKILLSPSLEREHIKIEAHLSDDPISFFEAEKQSLECDHCEVGGVVSQTWNLPLPVEAAILYHHHPQEALESPYSQLVDIVHVANNLAHMAGYGTDHGGLCRKVDLNVIERLNLTQKVITELLLTTPDLINSMASILNDQKISKKFQS